MVSQMRANDINNITQITHSNKNPFVHCSSDVIVICFTQHDFSHNQIDGEYLAGEICPPHPLSA